jgi:hypothetical protein
MCRITVIDLLYMLILGSNVCVIWTLDLMVVCDGVALKCGHYKMNIISNLSHPWSDSVMPLVLCIVGYSIRGTGVVL